MNLRLSEMVYGIDNRCVNQILYQHGKHDIRYKLPTLL